MDDHRSENGIVTIASRYSVDDIISRLEQILTAKRIKIFAAVDHSGEAESTGLRMPNTKLIIFGNPKAGTPLMIAAPTLAIDLPLKISVWEDTEARSWISYNSPDYLRSRHDLPSDLTQALGVVGSLAGDVAL